ncbi:MAG TPA: hypothetical protein VNN18_07710 [Candidatus Xenobia bacterium]|nr:hypothetical protein [Candidatus Xenobia bacterium]
MSAEKLQREINKWEGRLSELQQKAEQATARANTLEEERRALALAAAEGDEKSERAMTRKAADADEARRLSDNFALMARQAEGKLETLRDELAEAEWQERLAMLRQMCERRAAIIARVERAVAGLIEVLREVRSSSDEIVNLTRQFDDNFSWQHAREYFTTSLGYFLWAAQCELREQDPDRWHFRPRDPQAGVRDALVQYDRWCIEALLERAEQGVESAREARLRARGLIQEDTSERLYRVRHKVIRVGEPPLQAGQVISLRAQEAAAMGESVEPLGEATQQAP